MPKIELTNNPALGGRACGYIFEDVRFPDGVHVITSPVVDIDDQFFITASGTKYEIITTKDGEVL